MQIHILENSLKSSKYKNGVIYIVLISDKTIYKIIFNKILKDLLLYNHRAKSPQFA